jgi:hypothetical protein
MALSQQELWSLKDELELIKENHHYQLKNENNDKVRCKQAAMDDIT